MPSAFCTPTLTGRTVKRLSILALASVLAACTSPESTRTQGRGPGADVGNRGDTVHMHEGSKPYEKTPILISGGGPPLGGAYQAREMSRP